MAFTDDKQQVLLSAEEIDRRIAERLPGEQLKASQFPRQKSRLVPFR